MRCWAEALGDCGGKQSSEHVISKAIYRKRPVTLQGFPWCKNQPKTIGSGSATLNCLCSRHNSQLSPYDSEAAKLSRFLEDEFDSNRTIPATIAIDGDKLECWALKTTINLINAEGIRGPVRPPSIEVLHTLFRGRRSSNGLGLYSVDGQGESEPFRTRVDWFGITDQSTGEIVAATLGIRGVRFLVTLVDERADQKTFHGGGLSASALIYHPAAVSLTGDGMGKKRIEFNW